MAGGGHGQGPAAVVLEAVVAPAEGDQVGWGGVSAGGEGGDVVEVGAGGGGGAAGEAAGAVAAADEPGGRLVGAVDPGVDGEQGAGVGVVQHGPVPGVGVGQQRGSAPRSGSARPGPPRSRPAAAAAPRPAGPPGAVAAAPPQEHPPPAAAPPCGSALVSPPPGGLAGESAGRSSGRLRSTVVVIVAWPRIRSIIASARACSRRPVLAVGDVGVRELVDRGPGRRAGLGRLRGDPLAHPRIQAGADQDEPAARARSARSADLVGVGHRDRPPGRGPDPGGRQAQHGREQRAPRPGRRPPGAAGAPPGRSPRRGSGSRSPARIAAQVAGSTAHTVRAVS